MKNPVKKISTYLLIAFGLILALPFTPLRKSFNSAVTAYTESASENLGINDLKSKKIASVISSTLRINKNNYINIANNVSNPETKKGIASSSNSPARNNYGSTNYSYKDDNQVPVNANGSFKDDNNSKQARSKNSEAIESNQSLPVQYISQNTSSSTLKNINTVSSVTDLGCQTQPSGSKQLAGGGPPPDNGVDNPIDNAPSGGDNPIGTLPIGDGNTFLIILVAIFGLIKMRKLQ